MLTTLLLQFILTGKHMKARTKLYGSLSCRNVIHPQMLTEKGVTYKSYKAGTSTVRTVGTRHVRHKMHGQYLYIVKTKTSHGKY